MIELTILVFAFSCVIIVYLWSEHRYDFWRRRGVPYLVPDSFFFGNFSAVYSRKSSLCDHVQKVYEALAPHRYGGSFINYEPVLYLRDPDIIEGVLIADCHHIGQRSFGMAHERDPLSQPLFNLYDEEWKALRQLLIPAVTSGETGSLFEVVKACADRVKKIVEENVVAERRVNVKKLMKRYATDILRACVYELEADPSNNDDSKLPLRGGSRRIPTRLRTLYNMVFDTRSKPRWIVGHCPVSNSVADFSTFPVDEKENNTSRFDFLNLVARRRNKDLNMSKQFSLFHITGLEATAGTLSFILYELATHADVQRKLLQEIDRVLEAHDGEISDKCLRKMKYMEQVFYETTRLFPALPFLGRVCTDECRLPIGGLLLDEGQILIVPVQGLHRDPQYYYQPDSFNPENFSKEAIASRPAGTFLPFGAGSRDCIGFQFGMMQVKCLLTTLLRRYYVTMSSKMKFPLKMKPGTIVTTSKHNILLNFNRREE